MVSAGNAYSLVLSSEHIKKAIVSKLAVVMDQAIRDSVEMNGHLTMKSNRGNMWSSCKVLADICPAMLGGAH